MAQTLPTCLPACVPIHPMCAPAPQIMGKLTSLPFQACKHHISSLDAQPSLSGGVLVFVTGQLLVRHAGASRCCGSPLTFVRGRLQWAEGLLLLRIVAVADQAARQPLTPSVLCYHRCCVHSPTAAPVGTFQVATFRPSLRKPQPCSPLPCSLRARPTRSSSARRSTSRPWPAPLSSQTTCSGAPRCRTAGCPKARAWCSIPRAPSSTGVPAAVPVPKPLPPAPGAALCGRLHTVSILPCCAAG